MLQNTMKTVKEAEKQAHLQMEDAKKQAIAMVDQANRQAEEIKQQAKAAASRDADQSMEQAVREEDAKTEEFAAALEQEINLQKKKAMQNENEVISSIISSLS